jgi:hypothetical protein
VLVNTVKAEGIYRNLLLFFVDLIITSTQHRAPKALGRDNVNIINWVCPSSHHEYILASVELKNLNKSASSSFLPSLEW